MLDIIFEIYVNRTIKSYKEYSKILFFDDDQNNNENENENNYDYYNLLELIYAAK